MAKERIEVDVVGRDVSGSKVFKDVGAAADKAGDQIDDLGKKSNKTSEQVDGLGKSSKTTGEKVQDTATEFQGLTAEIAKTQAEMRRLATEIDKTGNKDLFKDLRRQKGELRKLVNARQEMGEAGLDGAAGFVDGLAGKLGPMLGALPVGPWLAPAITAAAPIVTGVIAGAVTAGVAIGVAGIGVKLATKDPAVQAAGKALGAELSQGMADAAKPFVPETLKAIGIVRQEWQSLKPDIDGLFADGAKYVAPLTRAATGFARELVPGLKEANRNAEPLIETLGEHGPKAGEVFGNALKSLSETAKSSAADIDGALTGIEMTITTTSKGIDLMNKVGPWVGKSPLLGWLGEWNDKSNNNKKANEEAAAAVAANAQKTAAYADAAARATQNTEFWTTRLMDSKDANMDSERATMGLEEAIDRAAEAGKRNNDGISQGTEKGRANRDLLVSLADATNTASAATFAQTGSQALANQKQAEGRTAFLRAADAMGVGSAEAKRLADMLFKIPNVKPKIELNTNPVLNDATRIEKRLKEVARQYNAKIILTSSFGGAAHTGAGYSTGYSEGGRVLGPGTDTSDSVVRRVSRDEFVIRARAARAIGYDALAELNQADRRPVTSGASSASAPASRGGSGLTEDGMYRAFVRALQTVPVSRDPALAANMMIRGG